MSANDVILLRGQLEESRKELDGLSNSEQEAFFFTRHYLHAFAPSHDDILSGLVDGALDGGIDGLNIFVNGNCIRDDVPLLGMGRGADLRLAITQVKNTTGFSEGAVEKLMIHLPELLALDRDERELSQRFNPRVLEVTRRFLSVIQGLTMPQISIHIAFASLRAADDPHPNVIAKGNALAATVGSCFGGSNVDVNFFDAGDIGDLTRYRPPTSKTLILAENPISTDTAGGFIGVVSLPQYNAFITDEQGHLDASIFEANVRDYENDSGVNESIQKTLEETAPNVDFWWLNNGVTVVADQVQSVGKRLQLMSPQVVNGLQTSHEIYKRGAQSSLDASRSVLVKVIEASEETTKDRIIRATNSQTTLGTSTLRATDRVQRKIETYLRTQGFYYERRKNFYRNQQIPLSQLVSIDQLGQAVTATLVQAPHVSRGEASRIFDNEIYEMIFLEGHPLQVYSQSILVLRACETFLRKEESTKGEVDNYVFHLATIAGVALTRRRQPSAKHVAEIEFPPSDDLLSELLVYVRRAYRDVVNRQNYAMFDQVAKDPLSTQRLLDEAAKYLGSSRAVR